MEMLMGKFCQFLTELSARDMLMARYYRFMFLFFYLQNACFRVRMATGREHLCHIDTFLVKDFFST